MHDLPIHQVLPALLSALEKHNRILLEAPPGAGKTTVVPLALLATPWLKQQKILLLEPRRIAARSAAFYMAGQLHEQPGVRVGYRIRFENCVGQATRIEVLTEGILTRMLQDDPGLEGVGCIIFDEFHERHLHADLALALTLDAQSSLRPDLRVLVMSATLDGERLASWLGATRVQSEGRSFPVQVEYRLPAREQALELSVARGVREALNWGAGDVLVFLPGRREIERAARALADLPSHIELHALHGELKLDAQAAALAAAQPGQRKVILATNVAESSLTLPGVRAVVDSGLAREAKFDPNTGFSKLELVMVSQASANQRTGRAGRLGPGLSLRLWSETRRLDPHTKAELLKVDLAPLALEIAAWGSADLRFLDPPPPAVLRQAQDLLVSLGALDTQLRLTGVGKRMLKIGAHPRLGNMLVRANKGVDLALACDLLALIEARDPFKGEERWREDWQARWHALTAFRARRAHAADAAALAGIDHAARQWRRRLAAPEPPSSVSAHHLGDLLLHAFSDRVAYSRPETPNRYALSNGRGAQLGNDSPLRGERWLVISELDGQGADARIRRAAPFDEALLKREYPERFVSRIEQLFEPSERAVKATQVERFDQLILSSRNVAPVDAEAELLGGIRGLGLTVLPWSEKLEQWRARVLCLNQWLPDLQLPDVGDSALLASLEFWLAPHISKATRLSHISSEALSQALRSALNYAQTQLVETMAPSSLTVPSGITHTLSYQIDGPPVLSVKLQELFGLAETPVVARGSVPVVLQLLSPGRQPIQVTRDLKNFWNSTYVEVRKELKGRYPRHPWPEDPWNAPATHRAKPRGT